MAFFERRKELDGRTDGWMDTHFAVCISLEFVWERNRTEQNVCICEVVLYSK
jgi:hypothetical protein